MDTNIEIKNFFNIFPSLPKDCEMIYSILTKPINNCSYWPNNTIEDVNNQLNANKPAAYYMSTMVGKRIDGVINRQKKHFNSLWVVVLDDINTKAVKPDLPPTYIIESSEGNYQWGYVIKSPIQNLEHATNFIKQIYKTPYTDSGGAMVNKLVRLPFGINYKVNDKGEINKFKVNLQSVSDIKYSILELSNAFLNNTDRINTDTDNDSAIPIEDNILKWLKETGRVHRVGTEFVSIDCPWKDSHTSKNNPHAGYSPIGLGVGDYKYGRSFNCFHDHCSTKTIKDFLEWAQEAGAPDINTNSLTDSLICRYAYIELGKKVGDLFANAKTRYPIKDWEDFKNRHIQKVPKPNSKTQQTLANAWFNDPNTIRVDYTIYKPSRNPDRIINENGDLVYNTYFPPIHKPAPIDTDLSVYFDDVARILPDKQECERFHKWIAFKLQNPDKRSFGIIMVAEAFGVGRTKLGSIIRRLFQTGVKIVPQENLLSENKQFNSWIDGTQLVIVQEMSSAHKFTRQAEGEYEKLKALIDTTDDEPIEINKKYTKEYQAISYAIFLIFTNHYNAIKIPEGDRRIEIYTNPKEPRSLEDDIKIDNFRKDEEKISALYRYYMELNISDFIPNKTIHTSGFKRMVETTMDKVEEIRHTLNTKLVGDIVSKKQIIDILNSESDVYDERQDEYVKNYWKSLDRVPDSNFKVYDNNRSVRVRILRNVNRYKNTKDKQVRTLINEEYIKNKLN